MKPITLKEFDELSQCDLENGFVLYAIFETIRAAEILYKTLDEWVNDCADIDFVQMNQAQELLKKYEALKE